MFVASWVTIHHFFWSRHQLVDTPVYQSYGQAMRAGQLPYRDVAIEYPPGALPAFVLPTYAGSYDTTFGWLMAICGIGVIAAAAAAGAGGEALAFVAVSPLLVGSLVLTRFDLWPTLLLVGSLAAFVRDRHRLGFAALGAAVAAKLFGIVVAPVALAWTWRRRGAREALTALAAGVAVVAAAFLPFAVLAPHGLWESLRGQASRPLQIESLAASALQTFTHPQMISSHGSQNLAGEGLAGAAMTAAEALVLVALWVAFARGPAERTRFLRYAAACVCAFVALDKVLSPQYLIWLVPLVPLVRGRRGLAATVLLAAALVATQGYFPARYWPYVFDRQLAWLVFLRDLLLVALLAVLGLPRPVRVRPRGG